jgi:ParB/RepB/Spo0J family partition protein
MTWRDKIEAVDTDIIDVPPGRRELNADAVARLASSMQAIGLQTPITVRYFPDRPSLVGNTSDSYVLVTGAHRLAAARSLGWERIDCFEVTANDIEAELWEIAENLHRAELTVLERDTQIARWIELTAAKQVSVQSAPKPKGGRPASGVNAASRELGIDSTDAKRAVKVASISDDAKQAARDAGLDDNRTALLTVAKETAPAAQVAKVHAIAASKTKPTSKPKPEPDRQLAASRFAEADPFILSIRRLLDLRGKPLKRFTGLCPEEDLRRVIDFLQAVVVSNPAKAKSDAVPTVPEAAPPTTAPTDYPTMPEFLDRRGEGAVA